MKTPAVYPAALRGLNLDQINYHLEQGYCSEQEAADLVYWWNTAGRRLTRAELHHYTKELPGGTRLRVPVVEIYPD